MSMISKGRLNWNSCIDDEHPIGHVGAPITEEMMPPAHEVERRRKRDQLRSDAFKISRAEQGALRYIAHTYDDIDYKQELKKLQQKRLEFVPTMSVVQDDDWANTYFSREQHKLKSKHAELSKEYNDPRYEIQTDSKTKSYSPRHSMNRGGVLFHKEPSCDGRNTVQSSSDTSNKLHSPQSGESARYHLKTLPDQEPIHAPQKKKIIPVWALCMLFFIIILLVILLSTIQ